MACRVHLNLTRGEVDHCGCLGLGCSQHLHSIATPVIDDLDNPVKLTQSAKAFSIHAARTPDTPLVVFNLKTRDCVVVIETHRGEHLYTVKSMDGTPLAEHLGECELADVFPNLYELFREGFAVDARAN